MKNKKLIILCIFIFLLFLVLYLYNCVNVIDNFMYNIIISIKNENITNIMKFFTFFGSVYFILLLMVLFLLLSIFTNKIWYILNIIIFGQAIINRSIKLIVRRDRPTLINLVNESSFSFPSGHTMVAVTLYGFLIYLIFNSKLNKNSKYVLISGLILLITLIIISRIYLGVHYFSDCIAGIFLALAYLLICIEILKRRKIL